MKKRLFSTLSDETEPITKRVCLLVSSPTLVIDEDESFLSLDSQSEHDDDSIENINSPCQQTDDTITINSDDDDDTTDISSIISSDDETGDISSIISTFISSPLNDNIEIIDLTEDEPNSPCCSFDQLEHKSSIDTEECPVCLEALSDLQYTGVSLMITQCHHVICILCSRQLLANSSRCPLCRENVSLATLMPYCLLT